MFNLLDTEGVFSNIIKSMCDNLRANIMLNDKRLKVFSPKVSALLFNKVLKVLARAIRQENKRHPSQKGSSKTVFLCR